jgi:hypothetical protein
VDGSSDRVGWVGNGRVIGYHPYIQPYHQTQNQTQTTKLKNAGKNKNQSTSHKFPKCNGLSFFTQIHTITKCTYNKSQFSRLDLIRRESR